MSTTFDVDLVGVIDARIWVDHWMTIIETRPEIPLDRGTMIGWFANAIQTGIDYGRAQEQRRDIGEKIREMMFQAAGAGTRPLLEDHPNYMFPSERVKEAVDDVCRAFGIPIEH